MDIKVLCLVLFISLSGKQISSTPTLTSRDEERKQVGEQIRQIFQKQFEKYYLSVEDAKEQIEQTMEENQMLMEQSSEMITSKVNKWVDQIATPIGKTTEWMKCANNELEEVNQAQQQAESNLEACNAAANNSLYGLHQQAVAPYGKIQDLYQGLENIIHQCVVSSSDAPIMASSLICVNNKVVSMHFLQDIESAVSAFSESAHLFSGTSQVTIQDRRRCGDHCGEVAMVRLREAVARVESCAAY